jgi:uncharacterized protein
MTRTIAATRMLAIAAAGALVALSAQARDVGIAASNPGSLYNSTAAAVAKVANDAAHLNATVYPFASATVYLPAVSAGEYQFGISNVEELRVAVIGAAQFKGRDYSNLRAVTILYPLRVAFFVRKDSPIRTVADLKGKRVVDGFSSQKTIPPLLDAEYATAGISRSDITRVNVPNVVAGANAFVQGKADAFFFALGAAKVSEAEASVGGIRALDVANTPENLERIRKFFPPAYLRPEKPSKRNVGVLTPIHVITYDAALVASTKTSDEDVYALAKAMYTSKKMMAQVFGVMNLFDPNRMVTDLGPIKWHTGAQKFYKEIGAWPPKQ